MNVNDAILIELAAAQSGSTIAGNAPNTPAGGTFDLALAVPGGPLAGHTLRFMASLVSQDAQIASIIQSNTAA